MLFYFHINPFRNYFEKVNNHQIDHQSNLEKIDLFQSNPIKILIITIY